MPTRSSRHSLAALVTAGALIAVLSGCVPMGPSSNGGGSAPRPGTSASTGDATSGSSSAPGSTGPVDCGGAAVTIADDDRDHTVTGDCPYIVLAGADIELTAQDAQIGTLEIAGDRAEVDAGDVDTLTVAGQENEVDAGAIDSIVLNGDRNEVEVRARAGSVAVNGNDNSVTAAELGTVLDQGQRNTVRTDD
ncbi:DUF3060 domain-containing protein [Microbacterium sp. 1P10UB]|uniref:DUF3060 domain-containing protein n=1 Tax=unclassified Microbacterium TaxID=2609290 RepID=UPI00399F1263